MNNLLPYLPYAILRTYHIICITSSRKGAKLHTKLYSDQYIVHRTLCAAAGSMFWRQEGKIPDLLHGRKLTDTRVTSRGMSITNRSSISAFNHVHSSCPSYYIFRQGTQHRTPDNSYICPILMLTDSTLFEAGCPILMRTDWPKCWKRSDRDCARVTARRPRCPITNAHGPGVPPPTFHHLPTSRSILPFVPMLVVS